MRNVLSALCIFAAVPSALAQTVDSSGAETLTANLSRYIGTTAFQNGIVKVAPDGDAYRIEFDFSRLVSLFPGQEVVKLDIGPYAIRTTPRSDGKWDVEGDMAPDGKVEINADQHRQTTEWTIEDDTFRGVYDPALAGFETAEGNHGVLTSISTDPNQVSEFRAASGKFEFQSTKNASSGVDFNAQQTASDFTQTIKITVPESGMELPIVLRSPELSYSTAGSALEAQPILDLLAFAVANADEAKMKAAQPQLKTLLRDALPLWDHLTAVYGLRELTVGTPMGIFGASDARLEVAMDGVRKDSTVSYHFLADGLQVPSGVLPQWSMKLMPEDVLLSFSGTELDLEGPATTAIDAFDLNMKPALPPEVGKAITARFLAEPPKLIINRSVVRNKDTEITAEGEMTFTGGKPALNATVEAAGLDAALQTIQEAATSAPEAQQILMVALAAKGFAKTLPDGRLQWQIDMTPDGAVAVNGVTVKPADPATPQ